MAHPLEELLRGIPLLCALVGLAAGCGEPFPSRDWPGEAGAPLPGTPGGDTGGTTSPASSTGTVATTAGSTGTDALLGWIGSPCTSQADCPYADATCLSEADGFPGGMCTLACTGSCPDEAGYPVTFCIDGADLPAAGAALGGACGSRCDFSHYPETGCREGYGCAVTTRPDGSADNYACLPNAASELGSCYLDLAARGVAFEPNIREDDHPADAPELTCHVEDALYLLGPVLGVDLRYYDGSLTDRVLVNCETGHAIADTILDVAPYGVTDLYHIGTYSCRTISGTDTLSQHGLGNAIDIYGFGFDDGTLVTLVDDWEHDMTNPETWAGAFLYDASLRWYDQWIWNIILTPNYNADHDNHFHVDLTEGSHYWGLTTPHHWGPAPYDD